MLRHLKRKTRSQFDRTVRRDEADVVRGWMSREESAPLVVGSVWHLLNAEWWRSWNAYVEHALSDGGGGGVLSSSSPRARDGGGGGSAAGSTSSSLSSDLVIQQVRIFRVKNPKYEGNFANSSLCRTR